MGKKKVLRKSGDEEVRAAGKQEKKDKRTIQFLSCIKDKQQKWKGYIRVI